MKTILEDIVDDSNYLKSLFQDINDLDELEDEFNSLPNIINRGNIVKFYSNDYNFTNDNLLNLLKDLDFLQSGRIMEILMLLKDKNKDDNYYKDKISRYLERDYDNIVLQETLFLTFIFYDLINPLEYFYDSKAIDKAIQICIKLDNLDSFLSLIDKGYDIKTNNFKLLEMIAEQNGVKILEYLIQNGANIHVQNDYSLRWTSKNGHFEIVKLLLTPSVAVNIHANDDEALRYASEYGRLEVVKLLLTNSAYIHAQKDYALRNASANGHLEIIKYLLENGANIHAKDDAALKLASKRGYREIVKYLEEQNALEYG